MKEFISKELIGTWKLVSWVHTNELGETVNYFGDQPSGVLMYDAYGNMNAQLTKVPRAHFASPAIDGGTPDETFQAFHSYIAYFGKYSEQAPGEVVHHVEGSLFPNWVNRNELRYATVQGDKLILNTPPVPAGNRRIVFTLTWQKVRH